MDYKTLLKKISFYEKKYNIKTIGNTLFNRKIIAVEIVKNKQFSTAFLVAGIHAREYITTDLVCKMLDENLFDDINKFNISILIMANPDGVELVKNGINSAPFFYRENLIKINNKNCDFSMWKANGRGVDINNNFDADFGKIINSKTPAISGYPGKNVESELETKSIIDYTKKIKPFITISYHSKGEEIYFNYFQTGNDLIRDELIAQKFANSTGYKIKNPELYSCGGFKDFWVKNLAIPALTIEVGNDSLIHPITENYLDEIYEKNKNIKSDLMYAFDIYEKFKH